MESPNTELQDFIDALLKSVPGTIIQDNGSDKYGKIIAISHPSTTVCFLIRRDRYSLVGSGQVSLTYYTVDSFGHKLFVPDFIRMWDTCLFFESHRGNITNKKQLIRGLYSTTIKYIW
jgi:hypothetical protein